MVLAARQAHEGWDLLIASAGRSAPGLLSFPYTDGICLVASTDDDWQA
jgi:hypothetical protein